MNIFSLLFLKINHAILKFKKICRNVSELVTGTLHVETDYRTNWNV